MSGIKKFKIVVFASGGGGNFQSLIDNQKKIGYQIILLICDRICPAIDRAKKFKIPYKIISKSEFNKNDSFTLTRAIPDGTNLIILAGFLSIIPANFCHRWKKKIINTHPSLLPKFGGKGMVGVKVQEAVMKAGEKKAGCTIHYVSEIIDGGEIILQKTINVNYKLSPWELGGQIHEEEKKLLPQAIKKIMKSKGYNR